MYNEERIFKFIRVYKTSYPLKDPIGVRAAPTITTSFSWFRIAELANVRLNVFDTLVAISDIVMFFWLFE